MTSRNLAVLLLLSSSQAKWGLGSCPDVAQAEAMPNFVKPFFEGKWYEIKRDKTVHFYSDRQCVTNSYKNFPGGMELKKTYKPRFFGGGEKTEEA